MSRKEAEKVSWVSLNLAIRLRGTSRPRYVMSQVTITDSRRWPGLAPHPSR